MPVLKIPLLVPFIVCHDAIVLHVAQEVLWGGNTAALITLHSILVLWPLVQDLNIFVFHVDVLVVGILGHNTCTRRAALPVSIPLRGRLLA